MTAECLWSMPGGRSLNLAVALTDGKALAAGEPLLLVTRDQQQAAAAEELGLELGYHRHEQTGGIAAALRWVSTP